MGQIFLLKNLPTPWNMLPPPSNCTLMLQDKPQSEFQACSNSSHVQPLMDCSKTILPRPRPTPAHFQPNCHVKPCPATICLRVLRNVHACCAHAVCAALCAAALHPVLSASFAHPTRSSC
ncbi:hypothetical protein GBA52_024755 [Prunus armeniaca]|nr:hypothetical protein GBA52_024755 [Prunus armeniaca]